MAWKFYLTKFMGTYKICSVKIYNLGNRENLKALIKELILQYEIYIKITALPESTDLFK